MKTKSFHFLVLFLLAASLLSACMPQLAAASTVVPASVEASSTPVTAASPTPRATRTPRAAAQVSAQTAEQAELEQAEATAQAYFAAVSEGNSAGAADLLSNFSLMVHEMTRGDAAGDLQAQKIAGERWSDFEIKESWRFDPQTILVQVTYKVNQKAQDGDVTPTATTKSAAPTATADAGQTPVPVPATETAVTTITKDELWAFRLENGAWRYNWNNLIDFRTLDAAAQTTYGITLLPLQLVRYSDRVALKLLAQNRTNDPIVFGQVNETLGTFYFGDQPVVAEKTRWILNPLRSDRSITLEANGLFEEYPDSVEIRKWKSYDVEPWYVFQF